MLRQGTCDQPGCGRSGKVIAKSLPSSGLWCDQCNAKRLASSGNAPSALARKNSSMHLNNIQMSRRKIVQTVPVKDLVKKLDDKFRDWRKKLDADEDGNVKCVTCDEFGPWQSFDLGHCFPRGNWAIRWHIHNCGPQCRRCNGTVDGEREKYKLHIDATYGAGSVDKLEALRNDGNHRLDPIELKALIKKYS